MKNHFKPLLFALLYAASIGLTAQIVVGPGSGGSGGGGTTTPGGADTSIQFNDGGAFGGFGTWNGTTFNVTNGIFNTQKFHATDGSENAELGADNGLGGAYLALGNTGIRMSSSSGILSILGRGPGADEILNIDLDSTVDTVKFTSGSGASLSLWDNLGLSTPLGLSNTTLLNAFFASAGYKTQVDPGSSTAYAALAYGSNANPSVINLGKSRTTDGSTRVIVQSGDIVGRINATGDDGNGTPSLLGRLQFVVDGTPGDGDMPGRFEILTTPDGNSVPAVNFTVDNFGYMFPKSTTFGALGSPANGAMIYCSDCAFANPCAGSGTGAIAKRLNGAWRCD